MKNQSGGVNINSEKLYTQSEVDELVKKGKSRPYSHANEILKESRATDKQKRMDNRTVARLVKKSNRILVSIKSHALPFDIIPDIMNVEEGRITIINRHLFSSEVHSVDIKNISNIFINRNILLSQLVIISKTYEENEIKIRNLRPRDAIFVRRIIEGLRVFEENQIETSNYSKEELIAKLQELSKTKIVT